MKIHWMKEPAQDKPVLTKPKTAIIDSNKMKLMGYMLQMFQVKEKDYSATTLLKKAISLSNMLVKSIIKLIKNLKEGSRKGLLVLTLTL